eukprot:5041169-Amphidinium_carterae.2
MGAATVSDLLVRFAPVLFGSEPQALVSLLVPAAHGHGLHSRTAGHLTYDSRSVFKGLRLQGAFMPSASDCMLTCANFSGAISLCCCSLEVRPEFGSINSIPLLPAVYVPNASAPHSTEAR